MHSTNAKDTEDRYYMSNKYFRYVENGINWYNSGENGT